VNQEQEHRDPEEDECEWCAQGYVPMRETLPNGEVIWAHWDHGVCHECTSTRG